jgi:chemotaxis protein CheX
MEATVSAAEELCRTALGTVMVVKNDSLPPQETMPLTGCFVSIIDESGAAQVGMASDESGCQALAQALVDTDEILSEADVTDALGEIANMLAGGVKKRLQTDPNTMRLGLPIIMEGRIRPTDRQTLTYANVQLGEAMARLVIVSSKE